MYGVRISTNVSMYTYKSLKHPHIMYIHNLSQVLYRRPVVQYLSFMHIQTIIYLPIVWKYYVSWSKHTHTHTHTHTQYTCTYTVHTRTHTNWQFQSLPLPWIAQTLTHAHTQTYTRTLSIAKIFRNSIEESKTINEVIQRKNPNPEISCMFLFCVCSRLVMTTSNIV